MYDMLISLFFISMNLKISIRVIQKRRFANFLLTNLVTFLLNPLKHGIKHRIKYFKTYDVFIKQGIFQSWILGDKVRKLFDKTIY